MPWLPSDTMDDGSNGHQTALQRQSTSTLKPAPARAMPDGVTYIPSQMDPLAAATVEVARQDPIRLMIEDVVVLLRLLRYLPKTLEPFITKDKDAELYPSLANIKVGFLQALLAVIQLLSLITVVPAFVSLPGGVFLTATASCCLACYIITLPMQGAPILRSKMDAVTKDRAERHKNERWIFVNGICTGHSTSQTEIDRLSKIFGRAVIGIHNKSYGLFADLAMCLIQRAISYHDFGTRQTYEYLKAVLVDPTVTKVVLIGHSQGGIIVSQAIDDLLCQLPTRTVSKLEVYTFGSAASHFSNPSLALRSNPSADQRNEKRTIKRSQSRAYIADDNPGNHTIPHMEHYANENDLVPHWGVLHSVQDVLDSRYAGSIFVRMGASGHMFIQHYLDPMFPMAVRPSQALTVKEGEVRKSKGDISSQDEGSMVDDLDIHFLDRSVTIDKKLAIRRDFAAVAEMKRESGLEFGSGQILKGFEDTNGDGCLTFLRTASDQVVAEEAKDKTVKELSRLWKYLGGKSPTDYDNDEAGSRGDSPFERHRLHHDYDQQKADQKLSGRPVLEQQRSPTSSVAHIRHSFSQVPSIANMTFSGRTESKEQVNVPRTSIQCR